MSDQLSIAGPCFGRRLCLVFLAGFGKAQRHQALLHRLELLRQLLCLAIRLARLPIRLLGAPVRLLGLPPLPPAVGIF